VTSGATHERLVDRARLGDAAAFAALYEELAPRVLRFLCHQVGDPDLAEELMQRTFVKVIEALPRFERRNGIPFSAWVFRVARNLAIDERRTVHPHLDLADTPEVASDEPGPEQIVIAGSQRDELLEALERLPSDQHDVIVYRFFGDLSPGEVAPLLHRSDGAIRVLQHRALRHLRELMAPRDPVPAVARAES
jgi:RNA polymerase sigma-70 factor (ECF subfamily)